MRSVVGGGVCSVLAVDIVSGFGPFLPAVALFGTSGFFNSRFRFGDFFVHGFLDMVSASSV